MKASKLLEEDVLMQDSVSRALIETVVRRALRDIGDSPERSSRNLIDMALTFAEGRFQQTFFQTAQRLLCDEHSAYYTLVRDVVAHVDSERLVSFGMNVGYNSCTWGARMIRENEVALNFDIPWSLLLEIDGERFAEREAAYRSMIEQGKMLGIYMWMLFAGDAPGRVLSLAAEHDDCAFALFCAPESVSEAFLDEAQALNNLMIVVRDGDDAADVCARLRGRKLLYSLYVPYGDGDADEILGDELLCAVQPLHPVFTAFVPKRGCSAEASRRVHQHVIRERMALKCNTVLWELVQDGMYVDQIISENACSAAVDAQGDFYALSAGKKEAMGNLFEESLKDVLCHAFPKGEA